MPRRAGIVEIIDLDAADRGWLMDEIAQVSAALKRLTGCDKLNVAAIGNVVPQLGSVHVVARRRDDPAWPRPVWGAVPARPYAADEKLGGAPLSHWAGEMQAGRRARYRGLKPPRFLDGVARCAEIPGVRISRRPPENDMSPRPDLGPKPHLGYTASPLDRAADRRADLAPLAADPRAGAYVVGGELVITAKRDHGGDPLFGLAAARALAPARETVFLGLLDGVPRFGLSIGKEAAEALKGRDDFLVTDLRTIAVQGLVAAEHLPPIAEAKALLAWHGRHRFCANCGAPTAVVEAGWKRECAACKTEHFPRTDPVVIMLAVQGERCLLGRSARFASAMWSCLAGFVEPGESIEEAARRETLEEAGIVVRTRRLLRFAALAVPDVADDRLPRRGVDERHQGRSGRARRRALVRSRGGGPDAAAPASRRPRHAAAGRDRAPHHPRLGRR